MKPSIVIRALITLAVPALLCACEPKVLPTRQHEAVSPDQVKIFQAEPKEYEILTMVSVEITPELRWDQSGDADAAFEQLKAKAAAAGANGLLLVMKPPIEKEVDVIAGYKGTFYQVPMSGKTAYAKAIYVVKE